MNLLLINPWEPELFPPPGLGYLKAFAMAKIPGLQVELADWTPGIDISDPDGFQIIGVTVHSFAVRNLPFLVKYLRQRFPSAHLVAGGHHASALPNQLLGLGFDQVVVGPGEAALVAVLEGNRQSILYGVSIPDINDYPIPDYSGLTGEWTLPLSQGGRALPIISSRGCPFECKFCASSSFWGRRWFPRAPDRVVEEIIYRLENSQMDSFMFEDDNFTLQRDRAIEICRLLDSEVRPRWPQLRWQAASRAETLDDRELCRAMVLAGCTHVWLGIESGAEEILYECSKATTPEKMLQGIKIAEESGLRTVGQFIVGLVGESDRTIEASCNFIRQSSLSLVGANKAWVLPRTYLHEHALRMGFNNEEYLKGVPFFTWENPESRLEKWVIKLQSAGPSASQPSVWERTRKMLSRAKRRIRL